MSRSIDQRIVEMRFDNAQFERGAKDTMSLLDRLKEALKFGGAKDGFKDVQSAANGLSLDGIAQGVENISSKFSALGAIGFAVLQDLTKRAIEFGTNMVKKVLDPIMGGGRTRALNMQQAQFQFEGLGMDVEATMENANNAVLGTAYGLDEAAVLAANFGATGMEAGQDMEDALRGVSGVAAMAGASYSDIGQIFSTVAGQGRLMGNDLNRLAARGVNAAATMAKQMGITEREFRELVSQGEISFQMFADGMNDAFGEHATKANETYTGSLSNMRAALARVGAKYFTPHLVRQRDLFNALTPLINRANEALDPLFDRFNSFLDLRYEGIIDFLNMLDDDKTGGRVLEAGIKAINQAFDTLMTYVGPVKDAFLSIFGGPTIDGVVGFLDALTAIIAGFALTETASANLQRTFAGVFAIFDLGAYVIWEVVKMIGRLVSSLFDGATGFLDFTGGIGDSIVAFRDAVKEGEGFGKVIQFIEGVLGNVIEFLKRSARAIGDFFGGIDIDFDLFASAGERLLTALTPMATLGKLAASAWSGFLSVLGWVWELLAPMVTQVGEWGKTFVTTLAGALRDADWSLVLDTINTLLLGGFFLMLRDFFKDIGSGLTGGGIIDNINGVFGSLTDTLGAMQNNLKAGTLLKIAGAIALLTASVIALSMVDPVALTKSLTTIAVMFGQLMGAMSIFSMMANGPAIVKLPLLAAGLILLAGAITVLTIPVLILSRMDWDGLAKGLAGLAGILLLMVPTAAILSGLSGSFIRIGLAMIPFAAGIAIMGTAIKSMGNLSWEQIGRGLTTMAGALVAIGVGLSLIPSSAVMRKAVSLVLLGTALNLIVSPLERMGAMSWEAIGKGLATLGGALGIMAIGLSLMGGTVLGSAALILAAAALNVLMDPLERMSQFDWEAIGKAMTVLAGSLVILAGGLYLMSGTLLGSASLVVAASALMILMNPLERMGKMDWEEIGKAMTVLAGGLVILAGGLYLMTGTLLGSAALVVATAALVLLVPVLSALGAMSWQEIVTGLAALAGVFTLIGIAGLLLTPVVPTLILLGVALTLIGGSMLLAGAGMLAFGAGLTAIGLAVATSGAVLINFLEEAITLLPKLATALANAAADFIVTIAERSGDIIGAFGTLMSDILTEIRNRAPEVRDTFVTVMLEILGAIRQMAPEIRFTLVVVVTQALAAVRQLAPEFAATAMVLLFTFLDTIEANSDRVIEQGVRILEGLIRGVLMYVFGMDRAGAESVVSFLSGIRSGMGSVLSTGVEVLNSLISGIQRAIPSLPSIARGAIVAFLTAISRMFPTLTASGRNILGSVGQGILSAVPGWISSITASARSLGASIVSGIVSGISSNAGRIASAATGAARTAFNSAKSFLGINSPSKLFMWVGEQMDEGWAKGMDDNANLIENASERVAKGSIDTLSAALSKIPDYLDGNMDVQPVVKPVLDLSEVKKGSNELQKLLSTDETYTSYLRASDIFNSPMNARRVDTPAQVTKNYKFEQTNTSPKALSSPEIYRNTKNLISRSKEAIDAN